MTTEVFVVLSHVKRQGFEYRRLGILQDASFGVIICAEQVIVIDKVLEKESSNLFHLVCEIGWQVLAGEIVEEFQDKVEFVERLLQGFFVSLVDLNVGTQAPPQGQIGFRE